MYYTHSFKIYQRTFNCVLDQKIGEVNVYKGMCLEKQEEYYVAEKEDLRAFSKNFEKSIKNVYFLKMLKEFESKPLDLKQSIDMDFFVFLYRSEAVACDQTKGNILKEIKTRKIQPQSEYTLQQLICFAMHRFNFEYFIAYLLNNNPNLSNIQYHNNCETCKIRIANNCKTQKL